MCQPPRDKSVNVGSAVQLKHTSLLSTQYPLGMQGLLLVQLGRRQPRRLPSQLHLQRK